jgi:hypothetical protein
MLNPVRSCEERPFDAKGLTVEVFMVECLLCSGVLDEVKTLVNGLALHESLYKRVNMLYGSPFQVVSIGLLQNISGAFRNVKLLRVWMRCLRATCHFLISTEGSW